MKSVEGWNDGVLQGDQFTNEASQGQTIKRLKEGQLSEVRNPVEETDKVRLVSRSVSILNRFFSHWNGSAVDLKQLL